MSKFCVRLASPSIFLFPSFSFSRSHPLSIYLSVSLFPSFLSFSIYGLTPTNNDISDMELTVIQKVDLVLIFILVKLI